MSGAPETRPDVALIGCGRWGRHVLRDLRELDCEVHVVARGPDSVTRARNGGAASIVGRIADLPATAGAVVATPTSTHADVVEEVLAHRQGPVYVEKPLCTTLEDADRLVHAGAGRLFVMDKWRYHPGVLELAGIARSGELGPVRSIHARRVTDADHHVDVDTVWTHAPHDLAVVLEILGHLPEPAFAVSERVGDGRVGLVATLGGPPWVHLELSCVAPAHRRELRMVCERGVAVMDGGWAEEVVVTPAGGPSERRALAGELPLLGELRAFVDHLRGGPPPKSDARDGAAIVRRVVELGELARTREEGVLRA